jgi:hypothetical protein
MYQTLNKSRFFLFCTKKCHQKNVTTLIRNNLKSFHFFSYSTGTVQAPLSIEKKSRRKNLVGSNVVSSGGWYSNN